MSIKRTFGNSFLYGIAPQIPQIANIIILPFITPYLSNFDYGVQGIVLAYISGFSILESLGLKMVYVNAFYHYQNQYKWAWRQIAGFLWIWSVLYYAILAVILWFVIPSEVILEYRVSLIIMSVTPVLFGPLKEMSQTLLQLKERGLPVALRSIILGLVSVTGNLIFIGIFRLGFMGWFYSIFITMILTHLFYLNFTFKEKLLPIFNFKWRYIKNSLKIGLPTIPHYYSSFLLDSSDRTVMDILGAKTSSIGTYNVAYSIGSKLSAMGIAAGIGFGPPLTRYLRDGALEMYRKNIQILQGLFLLTTFTISIWMKEIFQLVIQNDVLNTVYPLAIIIAMGYNYRPLYLAASITLTFYEKTKQLLIVSTGAGILNVVLNFIFIPIYGVSAAAYTTFFSLFYMGISGFWLRSFKEKNPLKYKPLLWFAVTIGLTFLAVQIVEMGLIYKFASTALTATIGLLLGFRILNDSKTYDA